MGNHAESLLAGLSFEPLTPTAFLRRAAVVFGDRTAVVEGDDFRLTYDELADRAERLAGMLGAVGVEPGDRVAVLSPNTHMLLEAHFGIPLAGAVLVALNTRLSAAELGYILGHSGSIVLLYDMDLEDVAREALAVVGRPITAIQAGLSTSPYEVALVDAQRRVIPVPDERGLLSLNYTSGTTGQPKGVMYHHRGAYLQALAQVVHGRLDPATVFLWTLPMFHCNGWCYPWAVTAAGGTHLCLRRVEPAEIWRHLRHGGVTHFNAAPTVLSLIAADPAAREGPLPRPIRVGIGGAPPSPSLLEEMAVLNVEVTHLYGLTETLGPVVVCQWRPEWDDLPPGEQSRLKARQGVGNVIAERVRVLSPDGSDVANDGRSLGEISVRGNDVMLGYYNDPEATSRAVPDGWFRTGDLGVCHPDGYIELRDRLKDIIISGGENVSSVEVEQAIAAHPSVLESAVVGVPDERWGEVPVAFVTLRPEAEVTADELIQHLRRRLAGFKAPKRVIFCSLPKTSTGKVQKYVLRRRAAAES